MGLSKFSEIAGYANDASTSDVAVAIATGVNDLIV